MNTEKLLKAIELLCDSNPARTIELVLMTRNVEARIKKRLGETDPTIRQELDPTKLCGIPFESYATETELFERAFELFKDGKRFTVVGVLPRSLPGSPPQMKAPAGIQRQ